MNIAIITGASSGIGREFVHQLSTDKRYDELWIVARSRDSLEELAQRTKMRCRIFTEDLTKKEALSEIEKALTELTPTVLTCINSAGFGKNGDFCELDRDEQLTMIDLNCRVIVELTHLVIPYMTAGSHFINISSIAGAAPLGSFALYGATKSFLTSFSVGIAPELEELNIGMTIVAPGSVDTNFQKRSRGSSGRKKKLFAKKSSAQAIVTQALRDSAKGRLFSVHGFSAKFAIFLSKVTIPYPMARFAYTKIYPKS
jgi:short-subunit dehydrogenase